MNKDAVLLLGRILIAILFVPAGIGKIAGFQAAVDYIAGAGLPMSQLMAVGAIVVELGVGLALLVGWKTRWAALILAAFTLVAALIFHNFWASPAGQAEMQMVNFFKNLAIVGGLLFVHVFGSGRYAVDKA